MGVGEGEGEGEGEGKGTFRSFGLLADILFNLHHDLSELSGEEQRVRTRDSPGKAAAACVTPAPEVLSPSCCPTAWRCS